MNVPTQSAPSRDPVQLREAWQGLRDRDPALRIRDAAAVLGASEAELLATGCGAGVRRLRPEWTVLLEALPEFGRVMALTRNAWAVHEKHGAYGNMDLSGHAGLVLNGAIDLRLFLQQWHVAFAVWDEVRGTPRRSLHIFDASGTAVHKVYLESGASDAGFDALAERLAAADQSPLQSVRELPAPEAGPARADAEVDVAALRRDWHAMQDTHEFHGLLRRLNVERLQALRLAGAELAWPVGNDALRHVLLDAARTELPIMVFVASPGVVQIHGGPVQTVREMGPWLNVLDPDFNLHVRQDGVASSWVVRKPTADGVVTSLELYAAMGEMILQVFGVRKPGQPEREDWRALAEQLPGGEAV
jgi:putative hemin transport protein